jgi:hypothetical protein
MLGVSLGVTVGAAGVNVAVGVSVGAGVADGARKDVPLQVREPMGIEEGKTGQAEKRLGGMGDSMRKAPSGG